VRLTAGLVLAALSTGALNWGFFVQHDAAGRLPRLSLRHPLGSLGALFGAPRWLAGYVAGLAGWGLYIVALALAPLSLVQGHVGGRDRTAGDPGRSRRASPAVTGGPGRRRRGPGGAGFPGGCRWRGDPPEGLALGPARRFLSPGGGYGVAAGLLYAAGDVATKAAVAGGVRLGLLALVAACHGAAFVLMQLGFQRGGALSTAGLSTVLTNALPIAAGIALFHEALPGGGLGLVRIAAFLAVIAAATLLARSNRNWQPGDPRSRTLQPDRKGRVGGSGWNFGPSGAPE
jgi:hypothetical protein